MIYNLYQILFFICRNWQYRKPPFCVYHAVIIIPKAFRLQKCCIVNYTYLAVSFVYKNTLRISYNSNIAFVSVHQFLNCAEHRTHRECNLTHTPITSLSKMTSAISIIAEVASLSLLNIIVSFFVGAYVVSFMTPIVR